MVRPTRVKPPQDIVLVIARRFVRVTTNIQEFVELRWCYLNDINKPCDRRTLRSNGERHSEGLLEGRFAGREAAAILGM